MHAVLHAAALGNIVSVLGLFFFIYAVIGMNLWGAVKHGQYLTRMANFQHVGMALLTLFRMITGAHGYHVSVAAKAWRQQWQRCDPGTSCVARTPALLVCAFS